MRPLPILLAGGGLPEGQDLERLKRAKFATGYDGMVLPRVAVPGSPAPILAVGVEPGWLTTFAYLPDLSDETRITAALTAVLIEPDNPRLGNDVDLLTKWFGKPVTYTGEEPYDDQSQQAAVSNGRAW